MISTFTNKLVKYTVRNSNYQHGDMYFKTFITLSALISVGYSKVLSFPSYINRCSLKSPDFDDCCLRSGRAAIPILQKGDKKYNIPKLSPLKIPYIAVDNGPGFSLNLKDSIIYGLDTTILKNIKFDLKNSNIFLQMAAKRLELNGQYDVNGRILVVPIQGQGFINITAVDSDFEFSSAYVLEERDGHKFVKLTKGTPKIATKRAYFDLTNLFNGNKELGEATNKVLNDDWEKVMDTIRPAMGETLVKLVNSIFNGFAGNVPYTEFFVD